MLIEEISAIQERDEMTLCSLLSAPPTLPVRALPRRLPLKRLLDCVRGLVMYAMLPFQYSFQCNDLSLALCVLMT
jgi:hypothetical protein